MAYPPYARARARELRIKNHLSLDELADHLALPKTTIYYWIKDLPLGRDRRESPHNGDASHAGEVPPAARGGLRAGPSGV